MRVRPASEADVPAIAALHERHNQRPADRSAVAACVREYPSAVAVDDDQLVGFAYCGRFAPDILELRNLLVVPDLRSIGVGGQLLGAVEEQASVRWAAVILVNSAAYTTPGKRPAAAFYERHGYACAWRTDATAVFVKTMTCAGAVPTT